MKELIKSDIWIALGISILVGLFISFTVSLILIVVKKNRNKGKIILIDSWLENSKLNFLIVTIVTFLILVFRIHGQ